MTRILVYRFSAMGDVILLLPVLKGFLEKNQNVEIVLLTQKSFFPFFNQIERLTLIEADIRGLHKNFRGLYALYSFLKAEINPDLVFDLHGVIRTYFLDFCFALSGYKVRKFKKGTLQKLWSVRTKQFNQLPSSSERYQDVFLKSGFKFDLAGVPLFNSASSGDLINKFITKPYAIGIAPFAKHRQKIWGLSKVDELIDRINHFADVDIFLFGGGSDEIELLQKLETKYSNCIVSAKYFKLNDEIGLIQRLDLMISMDSANMHLAAMAGIPTISVWGATHPALGFAPYGQPTDNIIQYIGDKLSCRPCSVYGNKKCKFQDGIRCMEYVSSETVFVRVQQILAEKSGT